MLVDTPRLAIVFPVYHSRIGFGQPVWNVKHANLNGCLNICDWDTVLLVSHICCRNARAPCKESSPKHGSVQITRPFCPAAAQRAGAALCPTLPRHKHARHESAGTCDWPRIHCNNTGGLRFDTSIKCMPQQNSVGQQPHRVGKVRWHSLPSCCTSLPSCGPILGDGVPTRMPCICLFHSSQRVQPLNGACLNTTPAAMQRYAAMSARRGGRASAAR
jgi:hypothetical protein